MKWPMTVVWVGGSAGAAAYCLLAHDPWSAAVCGASAAMLWHLTRLG